MNSRGLSLYRKYRPQVFGDVVGQESVTRSLLGALVTGGISHAYLFTGPRGSGKTTTARLLAKAVNCLQPAAGEPCNTCELCVAATTGRLLDIVELDAASNRGIDEVRQLREQVAFSPAVGRYKTYILDEVHMLTKDAANAFLKTLEEPPPHVIFVLATTEAHKVMQTIASRCQRYDFQRVSLQAAAGRVGQVLAAEGLDQVSREAVEEIVRRGDGSLRDMLGLLEQVLSLAGPKVGVNEVRRALGLARTEQVRDLSEAVTGRDTGRILELLAQMHDLGIEPHVILGQLTEWLREELLEAVQPPAASSSQAGRLVAILGRLACLGPALRQALAPRLTLEIGLLEAAHAELLTGAAEMARQVETHSRQVRELERQVALPHAAAAPATAPAAVRPAPPPAPPPPVQEVPRAVAPPTAPSPQRKPAAPSRPASVSSPAAAAPPSQPRAAAPPPAQPPPFELEEPPPTDEEPAGPGPEYAPAETAEPASPWGQLLDALRRESPQTHAFAKEGHPAVQGKKLRVLFPKRFEFHRNRLAEVNHLALLRKHARQFYPGVTAFELAEEPGPGVPERGATSLDKDWAEKRLVEDKTVQLILETFDGSVLRTE